MEFKELNDIFSAAYKERQKQSFLKDIKGMILDGKYESCPDFIRVWIEVPENLQGEICGIFESEGYKFQVEAWTGWVVIRRA